MIDINEKAYIDTDNQIEQDIGGCKVRLHFCLARNEKTERLVLDNLMLVFDRKVQGLSNVRA